MQRQIFLVGINIDTYIYLYILYIYYTHFYISWVVRVVRDLYFHLILSSTDWFQGSQVEDRILSFLVLSLVIGKSSLSLVIGKSSYLNVSQKNLQD